MEINRVSYEELLRIPGIGVQSALRILRQRKISAIRFDHLKHIGGVTRRAQSFITCCGKYNGDVSVNPSLIRNALLPKKENEQLSFWS